MEGTCLCKAVKVKVNDDNLFGEQRRGQVSAGPGKITYADYLIDTYAIASIARK